MSPKVISNHKAQLLVVLLCAAAVKLYYSTAGVNQLRWILAPTAVLVELVSGSRFEFEAHAGYVSSDRRFVIAASCAGVNFLLTSFLMLSLRRLWGDRSRDTPWRFIPCVALCAYLVTLVANTVRISTSLWVRRTPLDAGWLSPAQLHRFEGIIIYFAFLLLLFMVSEKVSAKNALREEGADGLFRRALYPLLFYYGMTLGIPLVNGAYKQGADFWEHALFVLLAPLVVILPLAAFRAKLTFWAKPLETRTQTPTTGPAGVELSHAPDV